MTKFLLSPEAQESLKQIKAYSTKQFGVEQTKLYLNQLLTAFKKLAENPFQGTKRAELLPGCYSLFIGLHTIYYRVNNEMVEVIDVLHQSMEPQRHLLDS